MRLRNRLHLILVAAAAICAGVTDGAFAYEPLPAKMDGTMKTYDFRHGDSVTPWRYTDMEPVAVAYVARHGSRYLSSEKKVEPLLKAVEKARKQKTLTADGQAFAQLLDTVCKVSDGKWGALSPIGEAEERQLGEQFCEQIGTLSERLEGNAVSSYVPRVVRTMWDFLYPVAANSKDNSLTTAEGERFSPLVRFFDTDSVYAAYIKDGDWKQAYDGFYEMNVSPEPARRMFGSIGDEKEMRKLTMDMYGVLQSLRCTGLPAPTTQWMTESEYRACWEASNLKRYLTRSETPLSTVAMRATFPLLEEIISRTDETLGASREVASQGVNANFWFGHAETLLPLTALMGLPGCVTMAKDWNTLTDIWRDYNITPMAANVLIVLLRDPKTEQIHAAVRLNGLWVSPVTGQGQLPTWDALRASWLERIKKFNQD